MCRKLQRWGGAGRNQVPKIKMTHQVALMKHFLLNLY